MRDIKIKRDYKQKLSIAFAMRIDGYTYEAIAEFLDITISNAKVLVNKAIDNERSA